MKDYITLTDKIRKSNLSVEDKSVLINLLQDNKTDHSTFVSSLLKTLGVAKEVFEMFDIDIGDLIDKF